MAHLPHLITDLALILCSAGAASLLFKKINQPVVLGYILAGLLVGPNFSLFPTITDIESIKIWAEIGVIFLLFSLGLEFSFKKLVKVGSTAAVTGLFEITFMLLTGYLTGKLMGWNTMDSLFLGGVIAISSTTIIFRAFDELNLKAKKFAGLVIGVLVIEDLVAVLLMVLLSTVAVSKQFEGYEMVMAVLKLLFFLTLWFLAGIYLIPGFLKKAGRHLSDETLMIIAVALCLFMVIVAANVGFSAALGAFIMGSILAETTKAERIEHVIKPVKDLFGAVFFVSVGMLINPTVLVTYAVPVIVLTLVVIIGKFVYATSGALISGQPLKQSVEAGTSLTQIGEFSFIIASLGLTLQVTSDYLYPIAVGVSVITTFTTPYMMKLAPTIHLTLVKILPQQWLTKLNRYSTGSQQINAASDWASLVQSFIQVIVINSVICLAIILLAVKYIHPVFIVHDWLGSMITACIALIGLTPFLFMLTMRKLNKASYTQLWLTKSNRGPIIMLEITRVAVGVLLLGFLFDQLFSTLTAFITGLIVIGFAIVIFRRRIKLFTIKIENRFFTNLNIREETQLLSPVNALLPWDAHVATFDVTAESACLGLRLDELQFRERYGINIAMIERGSKTILMPSKTERLYPYDRIAVIGTDEQLQQFKIEFQHFSTGEQLPETEIKLTAVEVDSGFKYINQSIRESGIREFVKGLVVGIERNGNRMLNPSSDEKFQLHDVVWIAGDAKRIASINKG
ncbi:MAG: cation:proton antiporter [Bacteroidia bacterium]|jgi:CPA2 family monovalent cation:H+ antiporter-2|nr:cation:proton antiporter [Bacteroidia bacterium]